MNSLKALFGSMGIFPTDEMLFELLKSCGKNTDDDIISFELFSINLYEFIKNNNFEGVSLSLIRRFGLILFQFITS